jgi:hypothetical protein
MEKHSRARYAERLSGKLEFLDLQPNFHPMNVLVFIISVDGRLRRGR